MPTYDFPALGFHPAPGDPAQISAQATAIRNHSKRLSTYASQLEGLKTDGFEGHTADAFREKLGKLPPDLHTSSDVYGKVATALDGFASTLAEAQRQAKNLEDQAAAVKKRKDAAQGTVDQHNKPAQNETDAQKTQREQDLASAKKNASGLDTELQSYIDKANTLHRHVLTEAGNTATTIRNLADAPPYKEPHHHWWDKVGDFFSGVGDWIKDHADLLRKISGILKMVSAVCGLLSFIPIVGPFFGAVALIAGIAALVIDVALKLATGEGSWWSIGLDAALTILPGGKLTKLLGKPFKGVFGKLAGTFAGRAAKAFSKGMQKTMFNAMRRFSPTTRRFEALGQKLNSIAGKTPWERGASHFSPRATKATEISRFRKNIETVITNKTPGFEQFSKTFSQKELALLHDGKSITRFDPLRMQTSHIEFSHERFINGNPVETPFRAGGHDLIPRYPSMHAITDPVRNGFIKNEYLTSPFSGRLGNVAAPLSGLVN